MHGDQRVKEIGQADAIGLGGEAKERTIGIKAPRQPLGGKLKPRLALPVEQFAAQPPISVFVGHLHANRPMPLDIDNGHHGAGQQPFDKHPRLQFFEAYHARPTSFLSPPLDNVIDARYQRVQYMSSSVGSGSVNYRENAPIVSPSWRPQRPQDNS